MPCLLQIITLQFGKVTARRNIEVHDCKISIDMKGNISFQLKKTEITELKHFNILQFLLNIQMM